MSLNTIIRKAVPGEIETLADIAFVAWERDLKPFLNGPAASRESSIEISALPFTPVLVPKLPPGNALPRGSSLADWMPPTRTRQEPRVDVVPGRTLGPR